MPHRWTPKSNGGIKNCYNNGKKKKNKITAQNTEEIQNTEDIENNLVNELLDLEIDFEKAVGCLDFLEEKTLECALEFIFNNTLN